ncbi:MAG TPA: hypothetical protein VIN60_02850, partial [Anaerolineales bacterium]
LARFIEPQKVNDTAKFQKWTVPLGEPVENALKRFLDLKLIIRADLVDHLITIFNGPQLKQMLVSRGLPVSGAKRAMATRLIEQDINGMNKLIEDSFVLVCSKAGIELARTYLEYEDSRHTEAIKQSEIALREKRFKDAALIVAKYEADSVFPRGLWISISTSRNNNHWKNYNPVQDEAKLGYIFTRTPKLLINKGWDKLPDIRIVAGMSYLWGNAEEAQIECGAETQSVANLLTSHSIFLFKMDEARQLGYKYMRVLTCNDGIVCKPCKKLAKTKHRIDDVPELPYEFCEEESGCRCWVGVVVE